MSPTIVDPHLLSKLQNMLLPLTASRMQHCRQPMKVMAQLSPDDVPKWGHGTSLIGPSLYLSKKDAVKVQLLVRPVFRRP